MVALTTSSPRRMHTNSVDDDGQNGDGLPETLDAHDTTYERDPKEAFDMKKPQDILKQDNETAYKMAPSLNSKDSLRAVLDVVNDELCLFKPIRNMSLIPQ